MDLHRSEKRIPLSVGAAILIAENGIITVVWESSTKKIQKLPPAELKANDPDGIERVKKIVKSLRRDLATWKDKIERYYLEDVSWTYKDWRQRYADHGTLSLLARRLIWRAEINGSTFSFMPTRDGCIGVDAQPVTISDDANVTLWHPPSCETNKITVWRDRLIEWAVIQPFRQAWREIYTLTDAERATHIYSNRFAGHILRQHQMRALAVGEGWLCPHRTGFDCPDDDPTYISIPSHGLQAEYWTSAFREIDKYTSGGSYLYIKTDRLKFHAFDPKAKCRKGVEVALCDIAPIVFSEIMRHCDLFTSVSSVSLDPEWGDRGSDAKHPAFYDDSLLEYWTERQQAPLPPSGEIRRTMLEKILTTTNWSKRVAIEGNYVRVWGNRNIYLINIGSSSICLADDRRHICIVPDAPIFGSKISLPFDGDRTLSVILSKILLLLQDDQIDDPIILRQI